MKSRIFPADKSLSFPFVGFLGLRWFTFSVISSSPFPLPILWLVGWCLFLMTPFYLRFTEDFGQIQGNDDIICPIYRLMPGFLGRSKGMITSSAQYIAWYQGILGRFWELYR